MPASPSAVEPGRIACALRNTGAGWQVIEDAGHRPSGITGVVTHADHIEVQHAVGGIAVSSLQVSVDETFAARGLRCGASVGVDLSRIYLYDQPAWEISDYVSYNGTRWVSEAGVFSGFAWSGASLTLTHEPMGPGALDVSSRGAVLAQAGPVTGTTAQLGFYTGSFGALALATTPTTGMRAYVTRHGQRAAVPPANPAAIVSATGNLWVTGLIEV